MARRVLSLFQRGKNTMKKTTKLDKLALTKLTIGQLTLTSDRLKEVRGGKGPSMDACETTNGQSCSC
jgi:hypothetical protein